MVVEYILPFAIRDHGKPSPCPRTKYVLYSLSFSLLQTLRPEVRHQPPLTQPLNKTARLNALEIPAWNTRQKRHTLFLILPEEIYWNGNTGVSLPTMPFHPLPCARAQTFDRFVRMYIRSSMYVHPVTESCVNLAERDRHGSRGTKKIYQRRCTYIRTRLQQIDEIKFPSSSSYY